ncbi:hypothetical protein COT29_01765 [Candidatus Micrarchaeota archaeon CG08_land_8_20_14_0_20_59_11]|nr:MAG: hypothetical protein COT29_01765 [Candidatus Micrarchaeota archaeon CG08_land_8_20_14_0_20_59_11]
MKSPSVVFMGPVLHDTLIIDRLGTSFSKPGGFVVHALKASRSLFPRTRVGVVSVLGSDFKWGTHLFHGSDVRGLSGAGEKTPVVVNRIFKNGLVKTLRFNWRFLDRHSPVLPPDYSNAKLLVFSSLPPSDFTKTRGFRGRILFSTKKRWIDRYPEETLRAVERADILVFNHEEAATLAGLGLDLLDRKKALEYAAAKKKIVVVTRAVLAARRSTRAAS